MPAHLKSSLFGCGLMIPIGNGQLQLGTWQGSIWANIAIKAAQIARSHLARHRRLTVLDIRLLAPIVLESKRCRLNPSETHLT